MKICILNTHDMVASNSRLSFAVLGFMLMLNVFYLICSLVSSLQASEPHDRLFVSGGVVSAEELRWAGHGSPRPLAGPGPGSPPRWPPPQASSSEKRLSPHHQLDYDDTLDGAPSTKRSRHTYGYPSRVPSAPSSGPSRYVPPRAPSSGPSAYTAAPNSGGLAGNDVSGSHPRTNSGDWWKEDITDESENKGEFLDVLMIFPCNLCIDLS